MEGGCRVLNPWWRFLRDLALWSWRGKSVLAFGMSCIGGLGSAHVLFYFHQ